jgi:hypothetical protein
MATDILGPGAFGDLANPGLNRKDYVEAHPDEVPPFDDRHALFPLPTPAKPTTTGGDGRVDVAFSTVSGGVTYTATSTPGNIAVTGKASPLRVSGLTNGTGYTFKVTAFDSHGQPSLDSPASDSVTPAAAAQAT